MCRHVCESPQYKGMSSIISILNGFRSKLFRISSLRDRVLFSLAICIIQSSFSRHKTTLLSTFDTVLLSYVTRVII